MHNLVITKISNTVYAVFYNRAKRCSQYILSLKYLYTVNDKYEWGIDLKNVEPKFILNAEEMRFILRKINSLNQAENKEDVTRNPVKRLKLRKRRRLKSVFA